MNDKRPLLVELPIPVKTYDIDFANIVHNIVYMRWLEDLRLEILEQTYPVAEMLRDGIGPILTRTELDHLWPARYGDAVIGRMWVSSLARVRWIVQGEIEANGRTAVSATQTGYFTDLQSFRPIRMPQRFLDQWQADLASLEETAH
jgi:acyl-CoA thioester hydrolase